MGKINFLEHISNLDRESVDQKLREHALLVYDIGEKVEHLSDAVFKKKQEMELCESKTYRNLSAKYAAVKKITPTRISHEVNANKEYQTLKTELGELLKALGLAKNKQRTLEAFREVATNFGHNVRQQKKQFNKG